MHRDENGWFSSKVFLKLFTEKIKSTKRHNIHSKTKGSWAEIHFNSSIVKEMDNNPICKSCKTLFA